MWYDSKARQFPVSIDITMATQCNYDMSDLVSDKKGNYHVVPNIPYKKYSELVDRKEKEFFYKDPNNANKLLQDLVNRNEKRIYENVAIETLENEEQRKKKRRLLSKEKNEKRELFDAISKIPDRESRKFALEKIKSIEAELEKQKQESEEIGENLLQLREDNERMEKKLLQLTKNQEYKRGSLQKYKTVAHAKVHPNRKVRQYYMYSSYV